MQQATVHDHTPGGRVLEELQLDGFKPFGTRQKIPLGPLTLIYGPNSAGKSSLVQALLLLRQSWESSDAGPGLRPSGPWVDLGTFRSLLHRHDLEQALHIGLKFRVTETPLRPAIDPGVYGIEWQFEAQTDQDDTLIFPEVRAVRYTLSDSPNMLDCSVSRIREAATGAYVPVGEHVFKWRNPESQRSFVQWLKGLSERAGRDGDTDGTGKGALRALRAIELQDAALLPTRLVMRADVDPLDAPQAELIIQRHESSLDVFKHALQRSLERIDYMGPLRSYPQRYTALGNQYTRSVGRQGEHTAARILRNPQTTLNINRWFERFEVPYAIEVERIGTDVTGDILVLNLLDRRTQVRVAPTDVGFGLGQILPVLVEGGSGSGRTICVEQPEIHLHPRMQAHLADFFLETARLTGHEGARRKQRRERGLQWILETHSEALMLRLQRRIRERQVRPDDICVLYVHPEGPQGSTVRRLHLDDRGEFLDEWPDGFFEESFLEVFGEALG